MINIMQVMQMMPLLNQFRQNPMQILLNQGFNIPQEYMNNPEAAAKYLLSNSNMSQDQINQIMNLANQVQQSQAQGADAQPQPGFFNSPFGWRR